MKSNMLYRQQRKGEREHTQLVVPTPYCEQVLRLAHTVSFAVHMWVTLPMNSALLVTTTGQV